MAKIFNICSICLAIALLLYACAPGTPPPGPNPAGSQPEPYPVDSPTPAGRETPEPTPLRPSPEVKEVYPPAVSAAVEDLSQSLSIRPDQVQVMSYQEEEWPDSCLGLAAPDEMCLQMITPGYRVLLDADGLRYEYHTDLSGDLLRVIGDTVLENRP